MSKSFRTFVVLKDGGGPRYEVVAWGSSVVLAPIGGGEDVIVTKKEFRDKYIGDHK